VERKCPTCDLTETDNDAWECGRCHSDLAPSPYDILEHDAACEAGAGLSARHPERGCTCRPKEVVDGR